MNPDSKETGKSALPWPDKMAIAGLCLMPLIGVLFPRFLGYAPAVLGLCLYLANSIDARKLALPEKKFVLWALALPLLGLASSLWAIEPAESAERALKTAVTLLGGILLFHSVSRMQTPSIRMLVKFFVPTFLASMALMVVELYNHAPVYHMIRGLPIDPLFNLSGINRAVITLVLPAFAVASMIASTQEQRHVKTGLIALAGLLTLAILAKTDSQSAVLGFGCGLIFYALPFLSGSVPRKILAAIVTILLLATPWLTQALYHNLPQLFPANIDWDDFGYMPHRMEIWDFVSRYALQSPLYGFGMEATKAVQAFDNAQHYHKGLTVLHPHNFAVQLWIEFGVTGAALASALLSILILKGTRIALVTLFATLPVAATGYGLWQGWWLGLFIMLFVYSELAARLSATPANGSRD